MGRTSQIVRIFASVARRVLLSVTFVWLASLVVVAENTDAGYSLKLKSIDADSIVLTLTNHTTAPVYLFDSYLKIGHNPYLYRYNKHTKEFKLSYLPYIQFLDCKLAKRIYLDESRIIRRGQILYSFTEIPPEGYIHVMIPKVNLQTDRFYKDVDMKSYTIIDDNYRLIDDLKLKISDVEWDMNKLTLEFAVYHQVQYFKESEQIRAALDHVVHIIVRDKVTTDYDIVTCTLNLNDIIDIDRKENLHE
ncbi:MAG: hypothetical protein K2I64_00620 [Muribaculaceae bacterium]|nr:hypothetical protein [Muribaculaceae bacterium]